MAIKHIQVSRKTMVYHAHCSILVDVNFITGKFKLKKLQASGNATPDDIKEAYNYASQFATTEIGSTRGTQKE